MPAVRACPPRGEVHCCPIGRRLFSNRLLRPGGGSVAGGGAVVAFPPRKALFYCRSERGRGPSRRTSAAGLSSRNPSFHRPPAAADCLRSRPAFHRPFHSLPGLSLFWIRQEAKILRGKPRLLRRFEACG